MCKFCKNLKNEEARPYQEHYKSNLYISRFLADRFAMTVKFLADILPVGVRHYYDLYLKKYKIVFERIKKMELKIIDGYYVDKKKNRWSCDKFTQEEAIKHSKNLLNCRDCTDCINCMDCKNCYNCKDCRNCYKCDSCTHCVGCDECKNCHQCHNCDDCEDCYECGYCNFIKNSTKLT